MYIFEKSQGPEGNRLEHAMGAKTESLDPPHNYVPWIVVDGEHDNDIQEAAMDNLLALVCKLYKVVLEKSFKAGNNSV